MKEREEKEVERVKEEKEKEETNEVEPPQFSIRSGRGFRPSTKREQIRMKLQQSKKKVCSLSKDSLINTKFISEDKWKANEESETKAEVPSLQPSS